MNIVSQVKGFFLFRLSQQTMRSLAIILITLTDVLTNVRVYVCICVCVYVCLCIGHLYHTLLTIIEKA